MGTPTDREAVIPLDAPHEARGWFGQHDLIVTEDVMATISEPPPTGASSPARGNVSSATLQFNAATINNALHRTCQGLPAMTDSSHAMSGPDELLAMMPYAAALGIELHHATLAQVTGSLAWAPERCTAGGVLHGGAIMSLADTIGAVCAYLNLPDGASTATIDSTTRLYRPLHAGTLHGTARPVHVGRTMIAVTIDLTDDQDRLVAQTSQAQAVIT